MPEPARLTPPCRSRRGQVDGSPSFGARVRCPLSAPIGCPTCRRAAFEHAESDVGSPVSAGNGAYTGDPPAGLTVRGVLPRVELERGGSRWSGSRRFAVSPPMVVSVRCLSSVIGWSMSSCGSLRVGRPPNTVRAYAHDLKTFFIVVGKDPVEVRAKDVFGFVTVQQRPRVGAENVARISDGGAGLSAATVRRRLAAVSAFYGYLVARGDAGVDANPVPRGLPTRRRRRDGCGLPLVRAVRRAAAHLGTRRGGGAARGVAHGAGSGDGGGDAVGRAAPLRGARPAAGGSATG
jgi:hypothetical protein